MSLASGNRSARSPGCGCRCAGVDRDPPAFGLKESEIGEVEPFGGIDTRYFGVFAPNARVRPRVVPAPPPPTLPEAASCPLAPEPTGPPRPRRPIPWAELLKRTFQADVLTCPRCGGTRRVVAVVLRSSTAQAILEHLRLPSKPLPLAPATSPPQLGLW